MNMQDVSNQRADNLIQKFGKKLDMKVKMIVHEIVTSFERGYERGIGTQQAVDAVVGAVLDQSPGIKAEIKCKKGCGFCCFQQVQITDSEKELISSYMTQKGIYPSADERKRLGRQARASKLGDWGELRQTDKRCIFLDEENACKIYEARPMACRSYLVVSDPSLCDTSEKIQKVELVQVEQADLITVAAFYADDSKGKSESLPEKLHRIFG